MAEAAKPADPSIARALTLLNEARQGLRPLRASARLCQAAQEHSEDMAKRGYFNYTPPNGGDGVEARIRKLGYNGRTGYYLGRQRPNADEAMKSWLDDHKTRPGLLDPDHRELGIGSKDGYWTLLLGQPDQLVTDSIREEMMGLFNDLRGRYHIAPLELQKQLNYIAQQHCADMGQRHFFEHINPDKKDVAQRANAVDYQSRVYELIGEGETAEEVFKQWSGNAAFRAQMTSDGNKYIGVGLMEAKWTVVLGHPIVEKPEEKPKPPAELKVDLGKLLSEQRTISKVPPLKEHPVLQSIAEAHAADMVAKNFMAYEYPGVPGIPGRIKDAAYKGRFFPAISKGQANADAVFKLFFGSEAHRKNFLDGEFRDVGIAVKDNHWVLLLGAPQLEASADVRSEMLRLLNAQRGAAKAPPLTLSSLLCSVAQDYAQDMVRRDFFGFANPEGKGPDALAKADGFPGQVLPSLVRGAGSCEGALAAWLKSPQSRASLLDPQYTVLGLGVAEARWLLLLGTAGPKAAS